MKNGKGELKAIIIMCIILVLIISATCLFVWSKLSKIEVEKVDKSNLSVNANLLEDVNSNLQSPMTKKEFDNVINIVLYGSDSRDMDMANGRSDTIMICSINLNTKKINLVSIPRDTYVDVEGYGKTKINHAYAYGKEQLSLKTLNSNFKMNLTEYITVNFDGLVEVIDTVGGININISKEEMQYINSRCYTRLTNYGDVVLDGEQALVHSRNRTQGNDFVRASRQRAVVQALITKISSLGLTEILKLSDELLPLVKTNINITNYIGILTDVLKDREHYLSNINSSQVPADDYAESQIIRGVYYYIADMEKATTQLYDVLYGK